MASPSAVMEQPNMGSDSGDASVAEPQEIVVLASEDPQTGDVRVAQLQKKIRHSSDFHPGVFRAQLDVVGRYFDTLRNQIPNELATPLGSLLDDMKVVHKDAEECRDHIIVKSCLAEMTEVLFDTTDIFKEISKTAEVQSSANKPWKLILNLFNKISRFMHYYRGKRMVSGVKDITVRLEEILGEGNRLLEESRDEISRITRSDLQYGSTTPDVRWRLLERLHKEVRLYLRKLRNSSNQNPKELITLRSVLEDTVLVAEVAERYHDDIMVKIWIAEMKDVLYDTDLFWEINYANVPRQTAEVQSSANKPWKLIPNLFNKISRFMHSYRGKRIVSKVKDITVRLEKILGEGKQLLKEIPDERTESGLQRTLATPDPTILERKQFANAMRSAIYKGDFWKVKELLGSEQGARCERSTTFEEGQTALQIAITAGQLGVAEGLIAMTSEARIDRLTTQDNNGNTALSFAARSGMMKIADCLIKKKKKLLTIANADKMLPAQLACRAGHEDMTRYLYCETLQQKCLNRDYVFYLLEECITKKMFHIALDLLHHFPKFAIYKIFKEDTKPIISTLAQTQPPFFRENQLSFWRRLIYNCTRVKVDKGSVLSDGVGSVAAQRRVTKIDDLKLMDAIAREILDFICRKLSALDEDEFVRSGAVEATFQAIKNGIPEIAIEIAKITNILWNRTDPEDERNVFACAVAHRQEEVAQFLYKFNARISTNIGFTEDRDGNNLLHIAAKLAPRSHLDYISGAALQLQSELRWFEAVEGIVPQFYNHQKNLLRETPSEVFVKEHKPLLKEAEAWMKKIAESFSVVGTLIITVMFAVAFTVPGGNDQHTGFPIFLSKTTDSSTVPSPTVPFMVFVVSDAISLFAATSSVLMFLGIYASRYAYKDFFKSLPVKLIIGISSLFISIAAMMVAFCVALFIMLQGRLWIIIPVTLLAGIPVIIFVLSLSPCLVELYTLTFGPGIFDRIKDH